MVPTVYPAAGESKGIRAEMESDRHCGRGDGVYFFVFLL